MYWNEIGLKKELICYKLNSNIRCIEIAKTKLLIKNYLGWIVTLDVLKYVTQQLSVVLFQVE